MHLLARAGILLLLLCILTGCTQTPVPTQVTEPIPPSTAVTDQSLPKTGWQEVSGNRYYLLEDRTHATGWLELDANRYYFNEDGILQTGWLELGADRYYLREDGSMARGKTLIDGEVHYFTAQGKPILLVNRWNPIPEDYQPDLVPISSSISYAGRKIDRICHDALVQMIADCKASTGSTVYIVSAYRDQENQTTNYNKEVQSYLSKGYTLEDARQSASLSVATPGTSEHQLGLAVDIIDTKRWALTPAQADLPGQKWLMENCWQYGFILRYPENKTDVTRIVYEPWHYRYVGTDVAAALHASGLTLEEYLESLH